MKWSGGAALKQIKLPRLPVLPPRAWYALLVAFILMASGSGGSLLWAARQETLQALEYGRRILIALEDGAITGNMIRGDMPAPEAQAKESALPAQEVAPSPETPADASVAEEKPPKELAEPVIEAPEIAEVTQADVMPDMSGQKLIPVPELRMMAQVNPSLQEKSTFGPTPTIATNGTKPWKYYSKPMTVPSGKPIVAIIISGLGHNKLVTDNALRLPENVTLSFSPYAPDISGWTTAARSAGHELLLDLPLEPSDYPASDPGPHGLLIEKGVTGNQDNLEWVLARAPVYVGLLTPQHENFTGHSESFRMLLQSLNNRGLLTVMGRAPAKNEIKDLLGTINAAHVIADMVVDEELAGDIIKARLMQLEHSARKNGSAIGIMQPYPISIQQLREWESTLQQKGIVLVPVSAIAKLKFS